ncbi:hypothetical protein [Paenibacillus sp. HB172176]|uniref:hypothetical protein n=1 Tax=Paenibacillus sp. HB172176 TaxID=2493690 RepID=UPI00143B22EB|nr:hypothetical protein [Paenibacillus sp. HB172176]
MHWRKIALTAAVIILLLAVAAYFRYRVTENQVTVFQMSGFGKTVPGSEHIIKDKDAVKAFTYGVRFADKQPGEVDIAAPPYQFKLGENSYYLWVSERYGLGTLMKLPNTGTTYRIGTSRAKELLDILEEVYGEESDNEVM